MYSFSRQALNAPRSDVRDLLQFAKRPDMISFSGGLPAAELFDVEGIDEASKACLREAPDSALQYGMTEGQPQLREALVRLLGSKGLKLTADELVITTGSQQAIDLVARSLLNPGDVVALERPTYLAALQTFKLSGASTLSVDSDQHGGCFHQLEGLSGEQLPKLVYVVSNFANPTGRSLSLDRRIALLRWAARMKVFVLEDDPYGELRTHGQVIPSMAALAKDIPGAAQWCGQTSTFSKTIAPGLRVGWLHAARPFIEQVVTVKQAVDLHTSTLSQDIAARYLASGRLPTHLQKVCAAYRERRETLQAALTETFGGRLSFDIPEGGMFLWARFTDGTQTRSLLPLALEENVMFVPGDAFYPDQADEASLRLNFSSAQPARIREGVARLARAHTKYWKSSQAAAA